MPKAVDQEEVPDWVVVAANRHAAEKTSLIDVLKTVSSQNAEEALALSRMIYLRHFEDFQAGAMTVLHRFKKENLQTKRK